MVRIGRHLPALFIAAIIAVCRSDASFLETAQRQQPAAAAAAAKQLSLNEMTAMEIVRQVAREHPRVAARVLDELRAKMGDAGIAQTRAVITELETPTDGSGCGLCTVR